MIDNIRSPVFQYLFPRPRRGVACGGGGFSGFAFRGGDFAVLYDAGFIIFEDDETDWFERGSFPDYFCGYVEVGEETVAYEDWVCDAD
jgi:hypothetical protein